MSGKHTRKYFIIAFCAFVANALLFSIKPYSVSVWATDRLFGPIIVNKTNMSNEDILHIAYSVGINRGFFEIIERIDVPDRETIIITTITSGFRPMGMSGNFFDLRITNGVWVVTRSGMWNT